MEKEKNQQENNREQYFGNDIKRTFLSLAAAVFIMLTVYFVLN